MKKEIKENFGGYLRTRVCGILIKENGILMVKHRGLSSKGYFWAPPGGGMLYGYSSHECLKREFQEETGLDIEVEQLLFVNEFHQSPLHALELFFVVKYHGGKLKTGYDPELTGEQQMIENVRYFYQSDFERENGPQLHSIFRNLQQPLDVLKLNGYFQNWK